jgi:hypothetical protein
VFGIIFIKDYCTFNKFIYNLIINLNCIFLNKSHVIVFQKLEKLQWEKQIKKYFIINMQSICHINKSSKKDEVNYKIILNHEIVEHDYESTHVSTKSKTFEITFKFLDETFFRNISVM